MIWSPAMCTQVDASPPSSAAGLGACTTLPLTSKRPTADWVSSPAVRSQKASWSPSQSLWSFFSRSGEKFVHVESWNRADPVRFPPECPFVEPKGFGPANFDPPRDIDVDVQRIEGPAQHSGKVPISGLKVAELSCSLCGNSRFVPSAGFWSEREVWVEHLRQKHTTTIYSMEKFKALQAKGPHYRFRLYGVGESENCLPDAVVESGLSLGVPVRDQGIHDSFSWREPHNVLFKRVMARYNELAEENTQNLRVSYDSLPDEIWLKILESPSVKWDTSIALSQTCKRLHSLWQGSKKRAVDVWVCYLRSMFPGQERRMRYREVREKWLHRPLRMLSDNSLLTEAICKILSAVLDAMDRLVFLFDLCYDVEHVAKSLSLFCPEPQKIVGGAYPWCLVRFSSNPEYAAAVRAALPTLAGVYEKQIETWAGSLASVSPRYFVKHSETHYRVR